MSGNVAKTGALAPPRINKIPIDRELEAKKLQTVINERNLGKIELKDTYGTTFTISDSSSAKQDAIWLSTNDALHLNIENAKELVEILNRFIYQRHL